MKSICTRCKGVKKVIGLGMVRIDCETCFGSGWIDEPEYTPPITSVGPVFDATGKEEEIVQRITGTLSLKKDKKVG